VRPHLSSIGTACRRGAHILLQREVRRHVCKADLRKRSQARESCSTDESNCQVLRRSPMHLLEEPSVYVDENVRNGLANTTRGWKVEKLLSGTSDQAF